MIEIPALLLLLTCEIMSNYLQEGRVIWYRCKTKTPLRRILKEEFKMKKVLSFVLVLSMILGSFGMAFAAAPSDVVGKDYEDAVNVLMELGVV